MGLIGKLSGNLTQGILGNLNEKGIDELNREYGPYLMDNESIETGFILIRDAVIFTDKRILSFDKQGATGSKMRVKSINLDSIIDVTAETAGFGFDDSEITITFITSPFFKASSGVSLDSKQFEFPKKYNIQPIYKMLQTIAYDNLQRING